MYRSKIRTHFAVHRVTYLACKASFKRRILHAPNAIQTIDN